MWQTSVSSPVLVFPHKCKVGPDPDAPPEKWVPVPWGDWTRSAESEEAKVLMDFSLVSKWQSFEVTGMVAPPWWSLNEQEESFPQTHRVAANENTPLKKWGAVCSVVSCAVTLQRIPSLSMIKNKPKYLGFPCSLLEYPGVPSRW